MNEWSRLAARGRIWCAGGLATFVEYKWVGIYKSDFTVGIIPMVNAKPTSVFSRHLFGHQCKFQHFFFLLLNHYYIYLSETRSAMSLMWMNYVKSRTKKRHARRKREMYRHVRAKAQCDTNITYYKETIFRAIEQNLLEYSLDKCS